jgi:hypothetical protein
MRDALSTSRSLLMICGLIAILAGLTVLKFNSHVKADNCAPVGLTAYKAWPQGTTSPTVVTVYLDPAWSDVN